MGVAVGTWSVLSMWENLRSLIIWKTMFLYIRMNKNIHLLGCMRGKITSSCPVILVFINLRLHLCRQQCQGRRIYHRVGMRWSRERKRRALRNKQLAGSRPWISASSRNTPEMDATMKNTPVAWQFRHSQKSWTTKWWNLAGCYQVRDTGITRRNFRTPFLYHLSK